MKQFFGASLSGNLQEAVRGLQRPQMLLLMSNPEQFEQHVEELEKLFPQVPSIGCIGMCYSTRVVEKGVGVVAFCDGVSASANVLEQVSTMPVKYIQRLQADVHQVHATQRDTVCIDFCAGNDACALTTIYTVLRPLGISLVGGDGGRGTGFRQRQGLPRRGGLRPDQKPGWPGKGLQGEHLPPDGGLPLYRLRYR